MPRASDIAAAKYVEHRELLGKTIKKINKYCKTAQIHDADILPIYKAILQNYISMDDQWQEMNQTVIEITRQNKRKDTPGRTQETEQAMTDVRTAYCKMLKQTSETTESIQAILRLKKYEVKHGITIQELQKPPESSKAPDAATDKQEPVEAAKPAKPPKPSKAAEAPKPTKGKKSLLSRILRKS